MNHYRKPASGPRLQLAATSNAIRALVRTALWFVGCAVGAYSPLAVSEIVVSSLAQELSGGAASFTGTNSIVRFAVQEENLLASST